MAWFRRSTSADSGGANTPIIVIVRDRLEPLLQLLAWLEKAGHDEIYLLDNASTYPPLVEFLATTTHEMVAAGGNLGHRSPWTSGLVGRVGATRRYVITDPDVVPTEDCPLDAVARFSDLLDRHAGIDRVGFGLKIDDLPDTYRHKDGVIEWEKQFWTDEIEPDVFEADIDTTFALYLPGPRKPGAHGLRTGEPYVARHLPWYEDSANPSDEQRYYLDHLDPTVNTWDQELLPTWLDTKLGDGPR